jgi:hypothetical protein
MVSPRRLVKAGLLLAASGRVTARPVPEPFSIRGLWGELTAGVGDFIDKTKNALFPSKISGSMLLHLHPTPE